MPLMGVRLGGWPLLRRSATLRAMQSSQGMISSRHVCLCGCPSVHARFPCPEWCDGAGAVVDDLAAGPLESTLFGRFHPVQGGRISGLPQFWQPRQAISQNRLRLGRHSNNVQSYWRCTRWWPYRPLASASMGWLAVVGVAGSSAAIPGFETEFLERIRELVGSLPKGSAELYVGRHPSNPKSLPYFRVTPTNSLAAEIEGYVCEGQGIDFKIGCATGGEVFVSSKRTARDRVRVEEFLEICRTVFASGLTETIVLNSSGARVHSEITLELKGRKIRLHSGWFLWRLFPNKTVKHLSYEPYYREST
jgi:hypothetical protein